MTRTLWAVAALLAWPLAVSAQEPVVIRAAVLRVDPPAVPPLSRLDLRPDDLGFAGAILATADNATTGQFMGQDFQTETVATSGEQAQAALDQLLADGQRLIVLLADDPTTLALADRAAAAAPDALIFNAGAGGDDLRNENCRANVVHVAPSRAMRTDALTQFLMQKRWSRWLLVHGSHPADHALADSYRRAATKFNAKIVEEREFADTGGGRRADTGHVMVQRQIPVATQNAKDHDILLAADESDVFAIYLPYQTWDARPVVGSVGLMPVSWHPALEAWGATQFQNRFERQSNRPMREADYQVWLALRMVGEAATRAPATDPASLRDHILGPRFEIAGFKGEKLTIRDWDHQLRQPILLATDRMVTSVSPQEQYLHQSSALDTLGTDRAESACNIKG